MDAEGRSEACDLGCLVHPERDGAANLEVVISVVLDEFHVRPPLTYRFARGHGLEDDGHRRGNGPFGAPVVDLDGARPDHDTPRHADSTGDAGTCSGLHQATLLFDPPVLESRQYAASPRANRTCTATAAGRSPWEGRSIPATNKEPVGPQDPCDVVAGYVCASRSCQRSVWWRCVSDRACGW